MPVRGPQSRRTGSRRHSAARSRREWLGRTALALGLLAGGYVSVAHALANVVAQSDPKTAALLAPHDGRILAELAWDEFSAAPDPAPDSRQARLAERALMRNATATQALNVLGVQAQLRSQDARANQVFDYAVTLSRRELPPQMWNIEAAVARGDTDGALHNYDVAMRTSEKARTIFFPILASAVAEPLVRRPLMTILSDQSDWARRFIRYVPSRKLDPQVVATFLDEVEAAGLPVHDADRAAVVRGLMDAGLGERAWAYYRSFRSGVRRDHSRDADFELDAAAPAPFDWRPGNAAGLSVGILPEAGGGLLDFSVPPSTRATIVRQAQLLPPGAYRLNGHSSGVDQPARSHPYWTLACNDGRELGRIDLPNSATESGTFSGRFDVPANCPVQLLSLVARASDRVSGVSGQIRDAELVPVNE